MKTIITALPNEQQPPGLYPEHWQRAQDGLCRLREEIQALDHPLITVRVLPAIEAAHAEAKSYEAACREEAR